MLLWEVFKGAGAYRPDGNQDGGKRLALTNRPPQERNLASYRARSNGSGHGAEGEAGEVVGAGEGTVDAWPRGAGRADRRHPPRIATGVNAHPLNDGLGRVDDLAVPEPQGRSCRCARLMLCVLRRPLVGLGPDDYFHQFRRPNNGADKRNRSRTH